MQRILLVVIVLLVVWRILAVIGRRLSEKGASADSFSRYSPQARRRRKHWSEGRTGGVEELVECASCGTFVPSGRALPNGAGRFYCSENCRDRAAVESGHGPG